MGKFYFEFEFSSSPRFFGSTDFFIEKLGVRNTIAHSFHRTTVLWSGLGRMAESSNQSQPFFSIFFAIEGID